MGIAMPDAVTISHCPACGAPLELPPHASGREQIKCPYCGTPLNLPRRPTPRPARAQSTVVVTPGAESGRRGPGCAVAIFLLAVLAVVAVIVPAGVLTSLYTDPQPALQEIQKVVGPPPVGFYGAPLALPDNDGKLPGLAILGRADNNTNQTLVIGFDPVQQAELWRSAPFGKEFTEMELAGDLKHVYVTEGSRLSALDRTTGELVWQASLANKLQTVCESENEEGGDGCLVATGEAVVALNRDGTLQGFGAANGAPLWTHRLTFTPRAIYRAGQQIGVVDGEGNSDAVFRLIDPAIGEVVQEIAPSCTIDGREQRPYPSDRYMVADGGRTLYVLGSGVYGCAWRYDLPSGELRWAYVPPFAESELPFAWAFSSLAVGDDAIYYAKNPGSPQTLARLDAATGEPQEVYRAGRENFKLVDASNGIVLVAAAPDYDSSAISLWGIDPEAGPDVDAVRWRMPLETDHAFNRWFTRFGPAGLFVGVCLWDAKECHFEVVDPATGVSQGRVTLPVEGTLGDVAFSADTAWLNVWGKLYAIDLATGNLRDSFP